MNFPLNPASQAKAINKQQNCLKRPAAFLPADYSALASPREHSHRRGPTLRPDGA
jgi:predicted component of type VI protein secretion system